MQSCRALSLDQALLFQRLEVLLLSIDVHCQTHGKEDVDQLQHHQPNANPTQHYAAVHYDSRCGGQATLGVNVRGKAILLSILPHTVTTLEVISCVVILSATGERHSTALQRRTTAVEVIVSVPVIGSVKPTALEEQLDLVNQVLQVGVVLVTIYPSLNSTS